MEYAINSNIKILSRVHTVVYRVWSIEKDSIAETSDTSV